MSYRTLDPAESKALLDSDKRAVCIDVRTVAEHEAGHIQGAFNVPVMLRDALGRMTPNPDFVAVVERHFEKDQPLVLACQIGGRSAVACQVLADAGFNEVNNMHGGYAGWPEPDGTISQPGWSACGFPCSDQSYDHRTYAELSDPHSQGFGVRHGHVE